MFLFLKYFKKVGICVLGLLKDPKYNVKTYNCALSSMSVSENHHINMSNCQSSLSFICMHGKCMYLLLKLKFLLSVLPKKPKDCTECVQNPVQQQEMKDIKDIHIIKDDTLLFPKRNQ